MVCPKLFWGIEEILEKRRVFFSNKNGSKSKLAAPDGGLFCTNLQKAIIILIVFLESEVFWVFWKMGHTIVGLLEFTLELICNL